jgi:MtN3 and saliva related transmembrane protein
MLVTLLAFATAGWGSVMGLAPLLQIRRIVAARSSRDVSVGYFVVLLIGFVLWIAYGISVGNVVLIVPNMVSFVVCVTTIGITLRYRRVPV